MFFLVMQFLWKYIDDLIGKGLEMSILMELLFYVSATLIPLALPLAVLFSSIMTYGNLAEHNELTALKASGQSLLKVMRPMFFFVLVLSAGAFYFNNYLLPIANYKWRAIIFDIQDKKPTFGITAGVFYNDIDGYSIRVDSKDDQNGHLEGVLIYEYTDVFVSKTIKAKSGDMLKSEDNRYLLLKLNSGAMYEKIGNTQMQRDKFPFQKTFFEEAIIKFDLGGFQLNESNEDLFKRDFEMINFIQLQETLDTMDRKVEESKADFQEVLLNQILIYNESFGLQDEKDSLGQMIIADFEIVDSIININDLRKSEYNSALTLAQSEIRSTKDMIFGQTKMREAQIKSIDQHKSAWHKKFTLSISILILFFIGAPLGAIIKKGGLGTPLVFATLFFLLYYILTIMGENMVDSGFIIPWKGMWISTFILAPLGAFLTLKAANDSALFDWDVYKKTFRKILRIFKPKKTSS
jgi:lipopolysaccharide export system permease protein